MMFEAFDCFFLYCRCSYRAGTLLSLAQASSSFTPGLSGNPSTLCNSSYKCAARVWNLSFANPDPNSWAKTSSASATVIRIASDTEHISQVKTHFFGTLVSTSVCNASPVVEKQSIHIEYQCMWRVRMFSFCFHLKFEL